MRQPGRDHENRIVASADVTQVGRDVIPRRTLRHAQARPTLVAVLAASAVLFLGTPWSLAQTTTGSLSGRVTDATSGAIVGARVAIAGPAGRRATTDRSGAFRFAAVPPGKYDVTVVKERFRPFERKNVEVAAGDAAVLEVILDLAPIEEELTIDEEQAMSLDSEDSAGAVVIKGRDLEALPDDPDELAEALLALAGAAGGPEGGQIYIDGFSGGSMPSKASIREIRINASPFSAEFDRLGWGRIEILTKPGSDRFRGDTAFRFNDESLNTRNPYAPNKPDYQERSWDASLGGPLAKDRASFFVNLDRHHTDDNDLVNATVLDESLQPVAFARAIETPQTRTRFGPRVDIQLGSRHTLTARYDYNGSDNPSSGIGAFSLPSRAYASSRSEHTFQIGETAVLSSSVANETRLQYSWRESQQTAERDDPSLQVLDAFEAGGAQVGDSSSAQRNLEIHNVTSWTKGTHTIRGGVRLRGVWVEDVSRRNFGGSVTIAGGDAPALDDGFGIVTDEAGQVVTGSLTSLERFQRTLLLQEMGLSPEQIRALGGGGSQLRIAGGEARSDIHRWDVAPFIQDDWRISRTVMLSVGLRYENQTLVSSNWNLAPRAAFAWAPRKSREGKMLTVVRGGFGVFYDRVSEQLALDAQRYDGTHQLQYVVSAPEVLDRLVFTRDSVTGIPGVEELAQFQVPQALRQLSPDVQAPITYQSSLSVEQMLPGGFTLSAVVMSTNERRLLRSRNVNAPLPVTGEHPLGEPGAVYQYESTGKANAVQLIVGLNNRMSRSLSLFTRYFLGRARSDTDGAGSFPANPYDLEAEYGIAGQDVRHRLILGGNVSLPGGVRLSPFVIASSGSPFNVTIGRDLNGDTVFNDRPAYATDAGKPGVVATEYGLLDPNPEPGATIIPRNLGRGPSFLLLNLRINKTFVLGRRATPEAAGADGEGELTLEGGAGGPPRGGPGRGPGRGWRHAGEGGDGRATLTLGLSVHNLLNNVNEGPPVGNLSSPFFGEPVASAGGFGRRGGGSSSAGNRRIILQARLGF